MSTIWQFSVLFVAVAAGAPVSNLTAIWAQEKEAQKGPDPFEGPFTNLKILKPAQVEPMMRAARAGLGQPCTLCHERGKWSDDGKPEKLTARMMIGLVGDINAKFGDGKIHVTCYTCHRGEEMPATTAPSAAK